MNARAEELSWIRHHYPMPRHAAVAQMRKKLLHMMLNMYLSSLERILGSRNALELRSEARKKPPQSFRRSFAVGRSAERIPS
jgi:hypothetical protein